MVAWDQEPLLSEPEIDVLLDMFAIADSDGLIKTDNGWVPSYNFRAAAKEGWTWKAGRCADQVSTDLDGDRMSANQLFDHCQVMINRYKGTPTMNTGQGLNLENPLVESFLDED